MSPLGRSLMNAVSRLMLRHVHHSTFEQLSSAGYDIRTFDDGAEPLEPSKVARRDLPEHWKIPQPVIVPKIATLRDTVLFWEGSALLPDGRYCFSDTAYIKENWRRPKKFDQQWGIFLYANPETDAALIRRHMRCIDVQGRCFSTRSLTRYNHDIWNFGHFVHDVLSRIYYEDLGALVPGRDRVIAPPMPMPMQKVLFRKVFEDYEIVQVPPDVPLKVEELLLPANLCNKDKFNPAAIAALARRTRRIIAPYAAGKRKNKICVSRVDGKKDERRTFSNEEAYEARMRELGFEVVAVSKVGPDDQFALWGNASDMVGIHGAGMMNMIMMPPEGNYTEIASAQIRRPCPNSTVRCAMAVGHNVGGLTTALDMKGSPEIDIDKLEAMLHQAP